MDLKECVLGHLYSGTKEDQLWMQKRLTRGLTLLLVATRYIEASHCDRCQLAIRRDELESAGFEALDCRWMIVRGFVDHLNETTFPGDQSRSFRTGDAILSDRSCFVLTEKGTDFAQDLLNESEPQRDEQFPQREATLRWEVRESPAPTCSAGTDEQPPQWDLDRQELWYSGRLIKRYRIPSPNQIAILSAFEEDEWPPRIDDPLPQHNEIDPRRRLNDTIRNLNRSRISPLIRFSGDGSGQGILWEPSNE